MLPVTPIDTMAYAANGVLFLLLLVCLFIIAFIDSSADYRPNRLDVLIGGLGVFNGFFFDNTEHAIFWIAYLFFLFIENRKTMRKCD